MKVRQGLLDGSVDEESFPITRASQAATVTNNAASGNARAGLYDL